MIKLLLDERLMIELGNDGRGPVRAAQVLAGNPGTIAGALAEFNRVRLPDVDALHTLDRAGDRLFGAGEVRRKCNERVITQQQ